MGNGVPDTVAVFVVVLYAVTVCTHSNPYAPSLYPVSRTHRDPSICPATVTYPFDPATVATAVTPSHAPNVKHRVCNE